MNMTISDLFDKIIKNENVPQKIRYKNELFEFKECSYYDKDGDCILHWIFDDLSNIHDEVEIVENKQDELLPRHLSNNFIQSLDKREPDSTDIKSIAHKINSIINYLQHITKMLNK